MLTFEEWPKIPRYKKELVITEKIDGTNACVAWDPLDSEEKLLAAIEGIGKVGGPIDVIHGDSAGEMAHALYAGSRSRWLQPGKTSDNFGFAAWVQANWPVLRALGPGRHYGEWYGQGIQRGYGLTERRFALFNAGRWTAEDVPACCEVVPVLNKGVSIHPDEAIALLRRNGSFAVEGYYNPEGIIIYHTASRQLYKQLIENDDKPKSLV